MSHTYSEQCVHMTHQLPHLLLQEQLAYFNEERKGDLSIPSAPCDRDVIICVYILLFIHVCTYVCTYVHITCSGPTYVRTYMNNFTYVCQLFADL